MTEFRSDFLKLMQARGQLHQTTDEKGLDALLQKERVAAYIGFDCTAPSLHVGSLVQIMTLRRLQQTGHKPIVLMGGGTTKVGDPSGKDEMRQLLTPEGIEANKRKILRVFGRFLKFGDPKMPSCRNAALADRFLIPLPGDTGAVSPQC
jgi:tyrosyl-tRNA synthetase